MKGLQKTLDEWKQKERNYQEKINDEAKELEKISSKQGLLLKKKEEAMKKIRDLGSLPSDAFDKYQVRYISYHGYFLASVGFGSTYVTCELHLSLCTHF